VGGGSVTLRSLREFFVLKEHRHYRTPVVITSSHPLAPWLPSRLLPDTSGNSTKRPDRTAYDHIADRNTRIVNTRIVINLRRQACDYRGAVRRLATCPLPCSHHISMRRKDNDGPRSSSRLRAHRH
jgi:hypothetical protein